MTDSTGPTAPAPAGDPAPGGVRPKGRGRFGLLAGLVIAAVAIWSGVWAYARQTLAEAVETQLAALADNGLVLGCADRSIVGYPFRLELRCARFTVEDRRSGATADLGPGRGVALLYRPNHIILEFDGPGTATDPRGGTLLASWRLLQASLRFSDGVLTRASLAVDGLDGRFEGPGLQSVAVKATHAEIHGRPETPDAGFDLAADIRAGSLVVDGRRIGPEAVDLTADTELVRLPPEAEPGLPAFLAAWAANDGRLDIRSIRLASGKLAVEGRGAMALEQTGLLTGMLKLVATGLESVNDPKATGASPPADLAVMASGFLLFGKPVKEGPVPGRSIDFVIEQGRMKLGAAPLGRLPPLFRPPQG
ncbi:DUF2125 domain-containing protein [Prosthecomicrobium sp. N25]|uniref:DUF2125 domain-containing protein n=1 Tax=Prosthecomicrobium sp. N25 TaxID=3129254 RepID=UPI003076C04C